MTNIFSSVFIFLADEVPVLLSGEKHARACRHDRNTTAVLIQLQLVFLSLTGWICGWAFLTQSSVWEQSPEKGGKHMHVFVWVGEKERES